MAQKKNTSSAAATTSQDMAQTLQAAEKAAAEGPVKTNPEAPASEPDKAAAAPAPSNPETSDASSKTLDRKSPTSPKNTPKGGKSAGKTPETILESTAQRIAREVFRRYPDRKAVYVVSDGTAFFNRSDAGNYGRSLKDTTVVEVSNQNLKA